MARIAVIGAGLGALAAAARLAVAGHRVTVYERGGTYGGALGVHEREGFRFDTGPGLLHLPAVYRDLFLKTGREPLEECVELVRLDPAVRHVFADGTAVCLPSSSRAGVIDALDAALGAGTGDRWADLLGRARTAWEATRRPLLEEPLGPTGESAGARARLSRDPYPALRRKGLLRRRSPTLAEVAADELRDPRLRAMLESHAHAYGLDPATAPASATVLPYMEHTFGTWYVRGGMRELARAVYERCLARGVDFRFETPAERVLEADGRVRGLLLADGEEAEADVVVVGTAWPLPGAGDTAAAREPGPRARARVTVLLALRGARPDGTVHRTVVHRPDAPGRPLTVLRPDDPALRPDGEHETAVLSVTVGADEAPEPGTPAGREWADRLVGAADAAGLGLSARVRWREVRTPGDDAALTGAPYGLVPPPSLAGADGALLRAPNRTEVGGLYRVGGWAHPGGGPAHAGMSGALVAGLVVEGDDWRGSH